MAKNTLEDFIEQATKNIIDDRAATKSLLMGIMKYMKIGDDRHREVGLIAAKYLETLQRSNEQLVKLATLRQKGQEKNQGSSDQDKQELFDLINAESEENKNE